MRFNKFILTTSLFISTLLCSFSSFSQYGDFKLGLYELNRGEFQAAIAQFTPLVNDGDAASQYQMALIYQNGYSVGKDGFKALELMQLSAAQNYPDALFDLAIMYTEGKLVKQDLKKAFQLTLKAAKKDLPGAQFNLAVMYANGTGVKQDDFKASRWYKSAANLNFALAQYNLALQYSEGKGVERSVDMSYVWNTIASWNGYENAEISRKIDGRGMSQKKVEYNTNKANKIYNKIVKQQDIKAKIAEKKSFY